MTLKTEHPGKITHINITNNGHFMTTACSEYVIIWELEPTPRFLLKVDITRDVDSDEEEGGASDGDEAAKPAIACLDNDCSQLYVYNGKQL
jgi:hypothetical protein